MKRRDFFQRSTLGAFGLGLFGSGLRPSHANSNRPAREPRQVAKNIIFMVSDGMSAGTLQLAETYAHVRFGQTTNWIDLYRDQRIVHALMETYSANSWVTDSAAASSSWGGGVRVNNGALNVGPTGEQYRPILQKFKAAGKAVGCVTSVPITHATPAGFCINQESRGEQADIAEKYLPLRFDCMLGGGHEYFSAETREDKQDMYAAFRKAGYHVPTNLNDLKQISADDQPVMGVFYKSGLPYALDHEQDERLTQTVPNLATMAKFAIHRLNQHPNGFVMQIEGGKVDWAAHANDTAAIIHDQLAFDEAVGVAIRFAEESQDTLVIVTTDHGNANPGLLGTSGANKKFETLLKLKHTNTWIMEGLANNWGIEEIRERVNFAQSLEITADEAKVLHDHIAALKPEDRLVDRKMPYAKLAKIQERATAIGWAGDDHSADFVELAAFGPGSELIPPFVKNIDLHQFMLNVTAVPAEAIGG
ncbi:MAG: alkaline phosphatase [Pirellulaceae bacterium]|nr:alkaline phosphatase [Pirellulaceae bacterium]